jgi:fluoroacetyl-CoA thioesterase
MMLAPGLAVTFQYNMTGAGTAAAVGSGGVPVLITPPVLALAERATVAAVACALAAARPRSVSGSSWSIWLPAGSGRLGGRRGVGGGGWPAVGVRLRLRDGNRPVASGHITRVVVDAAAFLAMRAPIRDRQVSEVRVVAEPAVGARPTGSTA